MIAHQPESGVAVLAATVAMCLHMCVVEVRNPPERIFRDLFIRLVWLLLGALLCTVLLGAVNWHVGLFFRVSSIGVHRVPVLASGFTIHAWQVTAPAP